MLKNVANLKKKGLGRGLDALLGAPASAVEASPAATTGVVVDPAAVPQVTEPAVPASVCGATLVELDPREIIPNPKQPRRTFNEEALQELAESIRRDGIQEPVIVRKVGDTYELVSGERRVRASIMADCATIPAVCRDVTDADMLKLGLIENIQREDLNPIELAQAYQDLIAQFDWTQEQLATEVGKNRATVTNSLRLLNLPPEVQRLVASGALTTGHAKALLSLPTPRAQNEAARKIIAQGLSVRDAEKLAEPKQPKKAASAAKDANIVHVESDLRRHFGTKVNVRHGKGGRGCIEIEYYSLDEFDRLLGILQINKH